MNAVSIRSIIVITFIALSSSIFSCDGGGETSTPELSINSTSIIEGNEGITLLQVNITSSIAIEESIEISFSTIDETAKAGTDFNQINDGLAVIPAQAHLTPSEWLGRVDERAGRNLKRLQSSMI